MDDAPDPVLSELHQRIIRIRLQLMDERGQWKVDGEKRAELLAESGRLKQEIRRRQQEAGE